MPIQSFMRVSSRAPQRLSHGLYFSSLGHDTFGARRERGGEVAESAIETAEAVRRGDVRARDVVEAALARIEARNPELQAFVVIDPELALAEADRVDSQVAAGGDPGPLAGVPFGVKDMDHCAGLPTSYGSLLHKDRPAENEDSVHVGRLRRAGAIPVGVTSSSEFGSAHWVRTKAWGVTRNPWNPALTPGGSSGGSAAAVAADMVPFATAGDGGGSTRIPAAFTGLVGMKPSFGRIPREGAGTSQTAVWGALTTTVADAARHLDVTAGPDDRDRTSLPPAPVAYERAIEELHVAALRTVWSPDLGYASVDPEVRAIAEEAASALVDAAGLQLQDRKVELTDPVRAWLGVGAIDIWLHLERDDWPARAGELGGQVRRSFEASAGVTAPRYAGILRRRTRLEHEVAALFGEIDVLLTPTTAVPAFAAEGPGARVTIDGREVEAALTVPFTMIANLCWNPAVSVPAGVTADGRPVGIQIMVRRHADDVALRLARILEQARPWPRHAPAP
jgi:aspartyl-tRNA(Asn)/glutamyl-tRNA(Gln) amidotransferase subunit A